MSAQVHGRCPTGLPRSRPSDLWPWPAHQWGAARNPGGGDCTPITCSTTTHHPPRCPNDNPKKRVFLPRFDQHTGWGKVPIRPPGGRAVGPRVSGAMSRWVYVVCHADPPFSTLCLPWTAGGLGICQLLPFVFLHPPILFLSDRTCLKINLEALNGGKSESQG